MTKMGEQSLNMPDENIEQHIITLFEKLEGLRKDGNDGLAGRVPARLEVRTLSLWKAVVAECAASFLYVFIVCGAAGGAGVGASASAILLSTALASGCAIATLTLCFVNISGAHINPAVSAALCLRRRVSPLRALLYVAAQCGGAIAGAAAIFGVSVPGYAGSLASALPGAGGAWERLGAELVLSGLVAAAYFAAMERRWTGAAPALLGAAYCAATFVSDAVFPPATCLCEPQDVGSWLLYSNRPVLNSSNRMPSLNPARSLGPAFVLSRWESHWVSWVGGLGGGAACALLHEWGSRRPRTSSRASSPRDLDDDKPAFAHYRHAPTYCAASAPRPDNSEPLYSGTKSLYCRSPPPARHTLHRSQSVYSKGSSATTATNGASAGAPLVSAQSLLLRPHATLAHPHAHAPLAPHAPHAQHALTHNQNAHNAQREPAYGTANGVRPGPAVAVLSHPLAPQSQHTTHSQNALNGAAYGVRPLPAGAPGQERRDSLYSGRRGPLSSEDSAYSSYSRSNYRPDHY